MERSFDTVNKTVDIWVNADEYKVESVESKTFAGYKQESGFPKPPSRQQKRKIRSMFFTKRMKRQQRS